MKKLLLLSLCLIPLTARAELKLANLFTSNMVLQQQSDITIWGTASAGKTVSMTVSWDGSTYAATADPEGRWEIAIHTPEYGGPYRITFKEGRSRKVSVLENVLIGDVWLCAGQSNMEMRICDEVTGMEETKKDAANHSNLRILHVTTAYGPELADDINAVGDGWQTCSYESINSFSAAGYYFGRELGSALGDVPIGLIESCLGGTLIQPWTSAEALRPVPWMTKTVDELSGLPASKEAREERFAEDLKKWAKKMSTAEAAPDFDDSAWEKMQIPGMIQNVPGHEDFNGFCWLRRVIEIPREWEGKDIVLNLGLIDDLDFSYFNGIEIGHSEQLCYRTYTVPGSLVKAGRAVIAIRLMDTGGLGGIYPQDNFTVGPEGEQGIHLEGEWSFKAIQTLYDEPTFPLNTADNPNVPSFLYNQMIHPLLRTPIKGVIWYQGESNSSEAERYKTLLPVMIGDWREKWGRDLPFYIAQIANYMEKQTGPETSGWAELREAQMQTVRHLDNTGLAVLIDIGEAGNIHPKNKAEVGRRLALNALALTYGKNITYSGPIYKDYRIEGQTIRISFDHCDGGLRIPEGDTEVRGFYVAGADGLFHKAKATIDKDEVVVSSPEVGLPLAVRYGWANNPDCNLYNGALLPASPFRTDSNR